MVIFIPAEKIHVAVNVWSAARSKGIVRPRELYSQGGGLFSEQTWLESGRAPTNSSTKECLRLKSVHIFEGTKLRNPELNYRCRSEDDG